MADQLNLNTNQLKQFAPDNAVLAFRPVDTGSPQQDWYAHLQKFPLHRQELEEFSVLGDVALRIAEGLEPEAIERVKILSLEYAVKVLRDETDAKEFVRCVKAIASPDAGTWELEQIAAFYYGEIRRRESAEVLKEMGLLGLQMEAVVATAGEREIEFSETEIKEQKLFVADQRRIQKARENQAPLPAPTPNFDEELAAVKRRIGGRKNSRPVQDDFADYYLSDEGKSLEELDADFLTHERLEQYDENGIVGFSMSSSQHAVVVRDFREEITSEYLPDYARSLSGEMNLLFVGHKIGGQAAQKGRRFVFEQRILQSQMQVLKSGYPAFAADAPPAEKFSELPFTDAEFAEWLAAKLTLLYPHRTLRMTRRLFTNNAGVTYEYPAVQEVNPDFEEMQYTESVCQILWANLKADFHLRSLRREAYQDLHLALRGCTDTAEVARLKKRAYDEFKEQKKLSLKEFTALNTAAKSQEARLASQISPIAKKTLDEISSASQNRLRFLKYFLYNDASIQSLTRQEKQRLWDAIRSRETALQIQGKQAGETGKQAVQQSLFRKPQANKQIVRVTPVSV